MTDKNTCKFSGTIFAYPNPNSCTANPYLSLIDRLLQLAEVIVPHQPMDGVFFLDLINRQHLVGISTRPDKAFLVSVRPVTEAAAAENKDDSLAQSKLSRKHRFFEATTTFATAAYEEAIGGPFHWKTETRLCSVRPSVLRIIKIDFTALAV